MKVRAKRRIAVLIIVAIPIMTAIRLVVMTTVLIAAVSSNHNNIGNHTSDNGSLCITISRTEMVAILRSATRNKGTEC